MKRSIFKDEKRPKYVTDKDLFSASLSYPQQRIRYANEKSTWMQEVTNESYVVKYVVTTVEVVQFRNKKSKPCNDDWHVDDMEIRNSIINNVKCIPPYWESLYNTQYSKCSNHEQMRNLYEDISWNDIITPCRIISKSTWFPSEFPTNRYDSRFENKPTGPYFSSRFYFPKRFFKEIQLVRAFDVEKMIANGGGYIGLCLGYSFLQLPSFLFGLSKKLYYLSK